MHRLCEAQIFVNPSFWSGLKEKIIVCRKREAVCRCAGTFAACTSSREIDFAAVWYQYGSVPIRSLSLLQSYFGANANQVDLPTTVQLHVTSTLTGGYVCVCIKGG